jgi:hypothetical protein
MAEPVSSEDIQSHPWLASWNKIDSDVRIDLLRAKVTELEDNLGIASIIILIMGAIIIGGLAMMLASGFSSGSVSMSQISSIGGIVKQFTGK